MQRKRCRLISQAGSNRPNVLNIAEGIPPLNCTREAPRARTCACFFAATIGLGSSVAMAEPLNVQATMVPMEQIKLDFKDGSGQLVLIVHRKGNASRGALLDGGRIRLP